MGESVPYDTLAQGTQDFRNAQAGGFTPIQREGISNAPIQTAAPKVDTGLLAPSNMMVTSTASDRYLSGREQQAPSQFLSLLTGAQAQQAQASPAFGRQSQPQAPTGGYNGGLQYNLNSRQPAASTYNMGYSPYATQQAQSSANNTGMFGTNNQQLLAALLRVMGIR
jgi:hypothetical protein